MPVSPILIIVGIAIILTFTIITFLVSRYKRCSSNEILVIFGKVAGNAASKCIHGGGAFVWPIIQDFRRLSLEPMSIDINLKGALSANAIRVNIPSTFTFAISKDPKLQQEASVRLLGMKENDIKEQAKDIILGQLRQVVASMTIDEINNDREKFMKLINDEVETELNKLGLDIINVNITDITDEAGYITALGQKAASEAINKAEVEVAEQEKLGAIGKAEFDKEREIKVAEQESESAKGVAEARKNKEIAEADADSEAETGKAVAAKKLSVARSEQHAESMTAQNKADETIAESNSKLAITKAKALEKSKVAEAEAETKVANAKAETERAEREINEIIPKEFEKRTAILEAEAKAESHLAIATGEANAIKVKAEAEADAEYVKYEATAKGFKEIVESCGTPEMAIQMMITERLPELMKIQTEAIANVKIDKVVVWGGNGESGVSNHVKDLFSMLPPMSETMKMAGLKLPSWLGEEVPEELKKSADVEEKESHDLEVHDELVEEKE